MSDSEDMLNELCWMLNGAGIQPWLHQHDCATWKGGTCNRGCSLELYRRQGVGLRSTPTPEPQTGGERP
jgi:hypothetical protein